MSVVADDPVNPRCRGVGLVSQKVGSSVVFLISPGGGRHRTSTATAFVSRKWLRGSGGSSVVSPFMIELVEKHTILAVVVGSRGVDADRCRTRGQHPTVHGDQ